MAHQPAGVWMYFGSMLLTLNGRGRGHWRLMIIARGRIKPALLFTSLFFLTFFLYLWLRINPSFYGLVQATGFQGTGRFLNEHLSYPGGIIDYCSAYLSAFFIFPVVGAAIVTLMLWAIAYAACQLLRLLFGPRTWNTAHLFPVVLCGTLQNNYSHPLPVTLALAIALLLFVFYVYQRFRRTAARTLFFLLLGGGLYYCAGGAFLLFALLCMLFEIVVCRRWILGLFYAAVAAMVPYFSKACLFLISTRDAYLHLLPFGDLGYNVTILPYVLYAYFPALFFISPGSNLLKEKKPFNVALAHIFQYFNPRIRALVSVVALLAMTIVTLMLSFNRNDNTALRFCDMSLKSKWTDILNTARENPSNTTLLSSFAVTQALFHSGSLPTEFFSFPQHFGVRGIFLSDDETGNYGKAEAFSLFYRGELAFKLGLVNSAQHWYYEVLSTQGVTAAVLKRLCQIHALKGDLQAVQNCLSVLETMPMQRKWSLEFGSRLEDRSFLARDPELERIQRLMPAADFLLADGRQPYHDCEEALRQHPDRMAFEYSMAAYLLMSDFSKICSLVGYLDTLGYTGIPLLYEQALVMLKAGDYPFLPATADRISQSTLNDFLAVDNILFQCHGNLNAAKEVMREKFGNSFWYYHFYVRRRPMREQ